MLDDQLTARFWQSALSKAHSGFEQLALLTELRDSNTGVYAHTELSDSFGPEAVDQALRDVHEQVFARWLIYSLEQKKADIDLFLTELSADKTTVIRAWRQLETYRAFIPMFASSSDRRLFLGDVETVLALLDSESLSKRGALTQREIQVLHLLAQGLTTKEIADMLSLSTLTVRNYRKNMHQKLGLRSARSLIAYALRLSQGPGFRSLDLKG